MADIVSDTISTLQSNFPQCKPFLFDAAWKFLTSLNSSKAYAPKGESGEKREMFRNAGQGFIDGYRNARDGLYDDKDTRIPEKVATSSYWTRMESAYPDTDAWKLAHTARFIDYVCEDMPAHSTLNEDAAFYAAYGFLAGFKRGLLDQEIGKEYYQSEALARHEHLGRLVSIALGDIATEYADEFFTLCGEPDTEEEMAESDYVADMFLDLALSSATDCLDVWLPSRESFDALDDEEKYYLGAAYLDHFCQGFFETLMDAADGDEEMSDTNRKRLGMLSTSAVGAKIDGIFNEFSAGDPDLAKVHATFVWAFTFDAENSALEDERDYLAMSGIAYSSGHSAATYALKTDSEILSLSLFDEYGHNDVAWEVVDDDGFVHYVDADGNEVDIEEPEEFRCEYDADDPTCLELPEELARRGYGKPVVEELPDMSENADIMGAFDDLTDALGDFVYALQILNNESLYAMPPRESLVEFYEGFGKQVAEDEELSELVRDGFDGQWPRLLRLAQAAAYGDELDRRVCVLRKNRDGAGEAEDTGE